MRNTAGTSTVTEFAYEMLTHSGYDPYIIFNAIPWDECVTMLNFYKRKPWPTSETGVFCGMEGVKVERFLPEFAIFNYILNFRNWLRGLEQASKHLVVGGTCIQGLPLAIKNIPFACWIGTTFRDQHKLQIDEFSFHRKYRNKLAFPIQQRYEHFVLESADVILVQSNHTKQQVTKTIGVPESRVEVLPFPIDTDEYVPGGPNNKNEILFVGRINAQRKNTALLLKAFAHVLEEVPEAELTLVGDEPNQELLALINDLEIKSSINVEGRVPDVVPYYQRAAVFALPSNQEGLGIVGLEAQSCGTPVVSTRCGGPSDYIIDGENGFMVPIGDEDAFAEALKRLLTNRQIRNTFGERSRDMVVKNYAMTEIKSKLHSYIAQL
ncbi:glycosyltransferase family 4 protein [Halobaculum sp. CBA1158]|uniref:glycosyltransferase family 4 protein n=1 Tax=Halobaculum sp. CBA1158 TaxID=2904243 RepID=UPI001F353FFC|nr:glycosyltransferase family 4 protein [Halobaculum sp. CBA1158]UIP00997.1 glycosyltransferase family 4 protein [Halobaculum sp. CBA1158]